MTALVDADHVAGVHVNMLATTPSGDPADLENLSDQDKARLAHSQRFNDDLGTMKLHSTRPHTVSYALTDSPVGQLAYIAEKLRTGPTSRARPRTRWTATSCSPSPASTG